MAGTLPKADNQPLCSTLAILRALSNILDTATVQMFFSFSPESVTFMWKLAKQLLILLQAKKEGERDEESVDHCLV